MSGCSLHEAFPDTAKQSGSTARREERAKARRCGGPALAFLKASNEVGGYSDLDPDRQAQRPLPPAEKMEGREGFEDKKRIEGYSAQDASNLQYAPQRTTPQEEAERELASSLVGQRVDDVIGQKSRRTLPRAAESPAQLPDFTRTQYGDPVPSYFGKGSTEGMADFSSSLADNTGYTVQGADFQSSFSRGGLEKATGAQTLPVPALNNVWKPITPTGANTSFFEVPPTFTGKTESGGGVFSREEKESLLHKLDTLFARLEEIESKRNEYAHAEVTLFIISGLVLMFGLESVRKLR
jgi:hypothetical protein